jgi:hypothetical protein
MVHLQLLKTLQNLVDFQCAHFDQETLWKLLEFALGVVESLGAGSSLFLSYYILSRLYIYKFGC